MNAITFLRELQWGLCWRDAESIAMIWAYYDESGEYAEDGSLINMSMAGCVSPLSKWCAFNSAWQNALEAEGLNCFHMTDFEAWKAPYDFRLPNGERDKERHNRLLNVLLTIMLDHIEHFAGFAESMPIPQDASIAHRSAMEGCIIVAMNHAFGTLWEQYREPLHLVFGHQKHFGLGKIAEYQSLFSDRESKSRVKTVTMGSPADIPPLQAADILAYEISKEQRFGRTRRYPLSTIQTGCRERGIPFTLNWHLMDRISDVRAGKTGL